MRISATDEDAVLLDHAESRRGLAGSRQRASPAVRAQGGDEVGALGCYAGAASEDVEGDAFA